MTWIEQSRMTHTIAVCFLLLMLFVILKCICQEGPTK